MAVYSVPQFVSATSLNWPGMVFTPDGRRVSLVGIDVQRTDGQTGSSQPPPQRAALVTIDAGNGREVQRVAAAAYRRSLLGSVGVSWSGRYAAGVFFDPNATDPDRVIGPWFHFSRSGRRLAMLATQTGRGDTRLRVWQVGTGERIFTLDWSRLGTRSAWSPDEHTLAVSADGKNLHEGDGIALFRLP